MAKNVKSSNRVVILLVSAILVLGASAAGLGYLYSQGALTIGGTPSETGSMEESSSQMEEASLPNEESSQETSSSSEPEEEPEPEAEPEEPGEPEEADEVEVPYLGAGDRPNEMKAAFLIPGTDFLTDPEDSPERVRAQIDEAIDEAIAMGLNTLVAGMKYGGRPIYPTQDSFLPQEDYFGYLLDRAEEEELYVYALYEPEESAGNEEGTVRKLSLVDGGGADRIRREIEDFASVYNVSGVIVSGYDNPVQNDSFYQYMNFGLSMGFDNFMYTRTETAVKAVSDGVRAVNPAMDVGLLAGAVWANSEDKEDGSDTEAEYQQLVDGFADTKKYVESGYVDFIMVENTSPLNDDKTPFAEVGEWWDDLADQNNMSLYMVHTPVKEEEDVWRTADQLVSQIEEAEKLETYRGSVYSSLSNLVSDTSGNAAALKELLGSKPVGGPVELPEVETTQDLAITNLDSYDFTTYEPSVIIRGTSDPEEKVTVNGETVTQDGYGYFSYEAKLSAGANTFTFEHKGKSITVNVSKLVQVLKEVSPTGTIAVEGGTKLALTAFAYEDAVVTASLAGTSVSLSRDTAKDEGVDRDSQYVRYTGELTIPNAGTEDQQLGSIQFAASWNGQNGSAAGAAVTVNGKSQVAVEGNLVQITAQYAETFPTGEISDVSNPDYYPLPRGAVDRVVSDKISYSDGGKTYEYYNLASGNRVYASDVSALGGEHYENNVRGLTVKNDGYYTYVTIHNQSKVSYKMSVSGGVVNIALLDTVSVCESLPNLSMNPVFSSAVWSGTTLQLGLRGKMMGVVPYYSDNDLVLRFHNPASTSNAVVVLDPGHSDTDPGSEGLYPGYDERDLNRAVAARVAEKLQAYGIRVVTVPTSGSMSLQSRIDYAVNSNADIFVSIHHNSNPSPSVNGTEVYYFNNQSRSLASAIAGGISSNASLTNRGEKYGHYYVTRHQMFPAVLAECGFMSNQSEYNRLCEAGTQDAIAQGITDGIISYLSSNYSSAPTGSQQAGSSSGSSAGSSPPAESGSSETDPPSVDVPDGDGWISATVE